MDDSDDGTNFSIQSALDALEAQFPRKHRAKVPRRQAIVTSNMDPLSSSNVSPQSPTDPQSPTAGLSTIQDSQEITHLEKFTPLNFSVPTPLTTPNFDNTMNEGSTSVDPRVTITNVTGTAHTLPSPTTLMPTTATAATPTLNSTVTTRNRNYTISSFIKPTPSNSSVHVPHKPLHSRISLHNLVPSMSHRPDLPATPIFNLKSFKSSSRSVSRSQVQVPPAAPATEAPTYVSRRSSISRIFNVGRSRKPKKGQPLSLTSRKNSDPLPSFSDSSHLHNSPPPPSISEGTPLKTCLSNSSGNRFPQFHKPTVFHSNHSNHSSSSLVSSKSKRPTPVEQYNSHSNHSNSSLTSSKAPSTVKQNKTHFLQFSTSDHNPEWKNPFGDFFPPITNGPNDKQDWASNISSNSSIPASPISPRTPGDFHHARLNAVIVQSTEELGHHQIEIVHEAFTLPSDTTTKKHKGMPVSHMLAETGL